MTHDIDAHGHPGWEALNDLADGRLPAAGRTAEAMQSHVEACAACQRTVSAIRALSREGGALARDVPPPPALWDDIARSIAAGGRDERGARRAAPAPASPAAPPSAPWRRVHVVSPRALAAAALVLMAVSSAVTALVLRSGSAPSSPVAAGTTPSPASPPLAGPVAAGGNASALPAAFAATEAAYLDDLAALHAAFAAQRRALSPATIAVIERSLAAIDAAIAEARAALLADPANQSLAELLSTTYQQKVELLRRAAEFSAT